LRGDIDVVEKFSPAQWQQRSRDAEFARRFWRLRHVPTGLQWIGWNEARPIFADRRVRRALTMLIDRNDIVDNLRLGLDSLTASWFYPGTKEYSGNQGALPYDPEAAADLLEDVGWTDTNGDGILDKNGVPFSFTFLYPAGPPFYEQLSSLMRGDFKKAGIEVKSARLEWAVYTERLRKHEFDACSLLWQMAPRSDPYQVWHSSGINGGSNFISFVNPELDRILENARGEFDEGKRLAMYGRFNQILREQQPYTLLFNRYNLTMVSKKFGGIISTPYGIVSYADLYVRAAARKPVATQPPPKKAPGR